MDLGNAIKSLRKELKISRKELAARCSISVTALYNIENNLSFPSKDTIHGICSALGVPVSNLMFYSLTEEDVPEDKRQFFKVIVEPTPDTLDGTLPVLPT